MSIINILTDNTLRARLIVAAFTFLVASNPFDCLDSKNKKIYFGFHFEAKVHNLPFLWFYTQQTLELTSRLKRAVGTMIFLPNFRQNEAKKLNSEKKIFVKSKRLQCDGKSVDDSMFRSSSIVWQTPRS